MRLLILTVSLWALACGKPEMYKEKEDFQYSRSSTDEGSKAGYYGAQRGNMGGNYEKAHNMDSLAQHQMSTLVRQVDGELGEGANTRTGSVFTAGNSRGVFGSGHYDLSNLKGRRFDEGEAYSDTHSSSAQLQNSDYYRNSYSGANNARYTTNNLHGSGLSSGYETAGLASQYAQANNQQAESQYQGSSNYEYGRQGGSHYRYYSHGGSQARSEYDLRNTNSETDNSYDANAARSRLISTTPVRVYIRPGTRVTIPVGAQTYDASHSYIAQEQSAANSEAELLNSGSRINIIKPASNAKHYESSYKYKKEWEKHDTQPLAVLSTESPFPANSELYEDAQLSQTAGQQSLSEVDSTNAQFRRTSSAHSSNVNSAYSSGYNANTKSATSNQLRYQSQQQNSGARSASNLYAVDTNGIDSGVSANSNSFADANTRPKSYQSSYSYHKSWERRGDPYVIKPVGDLNSQISQRLTDEYGLNYHQHGVAPEDCEEEHRRKRRSYNSLPYEYHPHNFHESQQELGQQTMDNWAYLGQQTDGQWDNLENLGQQTQDKWDNLESLSGQNQFKEELGQQSQNHWGNLEDLGQKTQNTWDNLENLNQQSESHSGKLENEGQQTQNTWNNLENINQQTQNQNEGLANLGQETQNTWDKLESFDQKDQREKLEDLGQQTQDTWGNLETLGQQTQNKWDKFETFDQQTQNQWDKTENNWKTGEDLQQQTRKEDQLPTANIEEIEQQNQNILNFLKMHQQVMHDLNKYTNSFKPQYNMHHNTQVNYDHEHIKPLDEIEYSWHQHSGNQETDLFPHVFDSDYHSTQSLTPNGETFMHAPSTNNNDLWDSVDKLIQESEKKECNDTKNWIDSQSTYNHNYFTSNSQDVYNNGNKEEKTTERPVIDEIEHKNEFFNLNKSDGTGDKLKTSSPEDSTELTEINEPEDIGRGDIGADEVPTVSIAEHNRNTEKNNTNLHSQTIHKIETPTMEHEEPVILDVMGLEQQYTMIPTSTHKPNQYDHIDLNNMHTLPNNNKATLNPIYKQQGHYKQDETPEIIDQKNQVQPFDNMEQTNKQDQLLTKLEHPTQTNNLLDQSLVDFGQQEQSKYLPEQSLVDFGQQTQENNWHDQSLVDFEQKTSTNNMPEQSLVDFGQQTQENNWHEQSLVDFGQQTQEDNWHEQSLVDFGQKTSTNNMAEQSLVDFGEQNQKNTMPEQYLEDFGQQDQTNRLQEQSLVDFGQQPQLPPKPNKDENLQEFSQTNFESLENFETQNIQVPYTNNKQVLSQNAKSLDMPPENNEKLQSTKHVNENMQEPSQNNFNQFDTFNQDDKIQNQQTIEKNSKSQNVEKFESESLPEQPLEVTEKPGFWSSVWDKTVKAKKSVASWFKS